MQSPDIFFIKDHAVYDNPVNTKGSLQVRWFEFDL